MIKKHYAMFDTTAQNFLNTFESTNHADAIRLFTTFVNGDKEKSNIARYPTQFMLFYMFDIDDKTGMVGTYNIESDEMEKQKPPKELIIGASCIEEQNKLYTIHELTTMLKAELSNQNVVDLANATAPKALGE